MSLMDNSGFAGAPDAEELAGYDLSDYGNAMRLIRLAGGGINDGEVDIKNVRLLSLMGQGWIGFNGQYWDVKYGEQLARRMAHMVGQKMRDSEVRANLVIKHALAPADVRKYLDGLGQAGSTSAMLKQAEAYLTVEIDAFDKHPMAINCQNGTLWLSHGKDGLAVKKRPHAPADRITRMLDTDYDKDAAAPVFLATLNKSLPDEPVRSYFQRALGYTLTGHIYEQVYFVCQGKGSDGKSTLLNVTRELMGGYGATAKVETFLDNGQMNGNGPQPELVRLAGDTRMAVLPEPPRGAKLNESLMKQWTGGDPYSVRQLQKATFEFTPIARLWIMCNALPVIKGDDNGIWRRTNVIMFEHQVPKGQEDKQLPAKLRKEVSGILNWLLAGVGDWLAQGLNPPDRVKQALDNYRKTSSPFGDWLEECCVYGEEAKGAVTGSGILYNNYKEWAEQNGIDRPMSNRAFGDALMQRQILLGPRLGDGKKTRAGIRLKLSSETDWKADQAPAGEGVSGPSPFDPLSMD